MKLIGKILVYLIWAVNWVISLLLVFSCYGSLAAPMGQWPFASLSGLAFPFLFATNLLFLLFWLLLWRKGALLPLITLLVCIGPTLKYCPIHLLAPRRAADADLTVVSYNTESFGTRVNKEWSVNNPVLLHALGFEADIILIQETHANIVRAAKRDKDISADYPYIETESTTSGQTCMSKFPIIHAETFYFEDSRNSCQYLRILLPTEDTLAVYNCHLQSNHLKKDELAEYRQFIEKPTDSTHYRASKTVLKKLLESTSLRAGQARMIADMAGTETARYFIVCGDFNDTPFSFSHRLFDRFMNDAFSRSGVGPGITYHEYRLYYRIDHIFCSRNMTPLYTWVDRRNKDSDHYPVISKIKLVK